MTTACSCCASTPEGGPVVFTGMTHEDFPAALEELSLDKDDKALVITGTGDSFMDQIDGPNLGEIFKPAVWEKTRTEGPKVLQRLLELPMPVVGVANGPAIIHSEYLLLSDIHIASERATYADSPHPAFGIAAATACRSSGKRSQEARVPSGCSGPASASTRRPPCSGAS
jgi:enoyl-CoA hydratase/carnithine racemase